jgi:DNA-binding NarL/FixJ family response regulator
VPSRPGHLAAPRPFSANSAGLRLKTDPLRILLVDDHAMFREGLAGLILQVARHATIVEAATCLEALEQFHGDCPFSIVLLDLSFRFGPTGLTAIDAIRARCAATPIVVVSGADDIETVLGSLDHGAMGFIPKTATADVLMHAIALVLAGEPYFPLTAVQQGLPKRAQALELPQVAVEAASRTRWKLTPRENEILDRVVQGKANKVIACELQIDEDTVRKHVSAILRKLGVRNRTQAVLTVVAAQSPARTE